VVSLLGVFFVIDLISLLSLDAELLEMIERADTDGDGEINPDEFFAIMTKKTFT
jgi:Ca2+-binding EF-hand superfamily protein